MITSDLLQDICVTKNGQMDCLIYLPHLQDFAPAYDINTPLRIAAFIAQIAHESAEFTRVTENLNYSAEGLASTWPLRFRLPSGAPNQLALTLARDPVAIANHVYSRRMGNDSVHDGWFYRGRGLKQITGKSNYEACGKAIGFDLVNSPDLLARPDLAVASACWYWKSRNLNALADKGNFLAITKAINGGTIGHGRLDDNRTTDRVDYYARARMALGINA